jgi:hypothetical protein
MPGLARRAARACPEVPAISGLCEHPGRRRGPPVPALPPAGGARFRPGFLVTSPVSTLPYPHSLNSSTPWPHM